MTKWTSSTSTFWQFCSYNVTIPIPSKIMSWLSRLDHFQAALQNTDKKLITKITCLIFQRNQPPSMTMRVLICCCPQMFNFLLIICLAVKSSGPSFLPRTFQPRPAHRKLFKLIKAKVTTQVLNAISRENCEGDGESEANFHN